MGLTNNIYKFSNKLGKQFVAFVDTQICTNLFPSTSMLLAVNEEIHLQGGHQQQNSIEFEVSEKIL